MNKRISTLAVLASAAAMIAAAPAFAQSGTLRMVPEADVRVLDPTQTTAGMTLQFAYMIYDNLFAYDSKGVVRPQMVEAHQVSADGRTYTFTLRPGLKFHDGTPVKAADAVASIKRWAAKDLMGKKLLDFGMTLAVSDDQTFTLTLREPFGLVLDSLGKVASSGLFIMREKDASSDPNTPITETVGSGPFTFVKNEWVPGSKLVFQKNADYVPRSEPADYYAGGRVVKVARAEWVIIPDANTGVAALNTGEVDIHDQPPVTLVDIMRKNKDVTVRAKVPIGNTMFLRPNHLHPPFNDVRVRRAVMHAVNQEDFMRAGVGDPEFWSVCWAVVPCGNAMSTEAGSDPYKKPDLARARALIKEAGAEGASVVVLQPTDLQFLRDFTEVAVQRMREIGLKVDAQQMDWATLVARRVKQDPPAQGGWNMLSTGFSEIELGNLLSNPTLSSACDKSGWIGWACDAEMEKLRDARSREADLGKRRAIAEQIQRRALDQVQIIPIGVRMLPIAYRNNISNILVTPFTVLWNVEKR